MIEVGTPHKTKEVDFLVPVCDDAERRTKETTMLTTKNERAKRQSVPSPELEHEAGERLRTLLTEHLDNLDAPLHRNWQKRYRRIF